MVDLTKCLNCRWFLSCYDINQNGCESYEYKPISAYYQNQSNMQKEGVINDNNS